VSVDFSCGCHQYDCRALFASDKACLALLHHSRFRDRRIRLLGLSAWLAKLWTGGLIGALGNAYGDGLSFFPSASMGEPLKAYSEIRGITWSASLTQPSWRNTAETLTTLRDLESSLIHPA
jgi:hypothetical protein